MLMVVQILAALSGRMFWRKEKGGGGGGGRGLEETASF